MGLIQMKYQKTAKPCSLVGSFCSVLTTGPTCAVAPGAPRIGRPDTQQSLPARGAGCQGVPRAILAFPRVSGRWTLVCDRPACTERKIKLYFLAEGEKELIFGYASFVPVRVLDFFFF